MSLTDPIDVHLELARKNLERGITDDLAGTTVASVLSLIPGAGAAIQSLLDGKARANVDRRWLELFIEMRMRIEKVRDSIPDQDYYGSEEFQTLLALAQE